MQNEETDTGEKRPDPVLCNIREEWEWVKPGIEEILTEQKFLTFRPEDVYAECLNKTAYLWCTDDGFVVTTTEIDEFNNEKIFFFWLAWAKTRGQNLIGIHQRFFADAAKDAGYHRLSVYTPVRGVERYLLMSGWERETAVYTRYL